MASTFVVIAFAGVLMLPHVKGPVWLRRLGRVLAGALALALSWATLALYQIGAERNWTGDGPGMLVVMLLIPVAALCALAAWFGTLWPGASRSGRLSIPPWIPIGMIVVGLAGSTKSADDYRRELRHAHEAPVVALQLAEAGTRLVSIDGAGTVMRWKVPERALIDVRAFGALAGAERILITSDGRFAVALVEEGVRIVPLDADASTPVTLRSVTQAALLGNGEAAFAEANEVRIAPLVAPGVARATHPFSAGISSLAVATGGPLFVGLVDGSIVALGEHGEPDRTLTRLGAAAHRLVVSPDGRWLVALDTEARPTFVPTRSGEPRRVDAWIRMHMLAFVNDEHLVFITSEMDPSALAFSLERFQTEPFFNHGRTITAFGAAPGTPEVAIALGGDLHLVPTPVAGLHAYASSSVRLVQRSTF